MKSNTTESFNFGHRTTGLNRIWFLNSVYLHHTINISAAIYLNLITLSIYFFMIGFVDKNVEIDPHCNSELLNFHRPWFGIRLNWLLPIWTWWVIDFVTKWKTGAGSKWFLHSTNILSLLQNHWRNHWPLISNINLDEFQEMPIYIQWKTCT